MDLFVENIKKSFKKKTVLKNISFEASKGQCIGILGCNGCGKSTLLNIMSGIIKPSGGNVIFNDTNLLKSVKKREKIIAYVPQTPPLIEELNAYDNLSLWYSKNALRKSLESGVLFKLGINEFLKTTVSKMSGGMKKRLSIGCAISNNPQIILMDEPTSALDPQCKAIVFDYIKEFKLRGGIVILVTHDYSETSICDICYSMINGVLVKTAECKFDGTTENKL